MTFCRLPILQGGTFALLTPAMALLSTPQMKCPAWTQNASLVNTSSPAFVEVWQTRMRTVGHRIHSSGWKPNRADRADSGVGVCSRPQLQGSVMVASVLQIVVGFSGLIGFLMRFIGPLTIAPTISLMGLSLYDSAGAKAGSHWGISAMSVTPHSQGYGDAVSLGNDDFSCMQGHGADHPVFPVPASHSDPCSCIQQS